ncbi:unnamed protein product [Scytosiphon promiscuus]
MPKKAVKTATAVLGTLGTLALLASVGHRSGRHRVPERPSFGATATARNTRLLQAQDLGEKTPLEVDFVPHVVSGVLQKTVFSSEMRMVFLVGLEGTGHHFMTNVLVNMCKFDEVSCTDAWSLAVALYSKLGTPETPSDYATGLERLRNESGKIALQSDVSPNGAITLVTFWQRRRGIGMMSFPNFTGSDKPLQYVDLRILAAEAERAGIDVRLIYMTRSARNILLSDTQHRHFGGGFTRETRTLINNAAVIDSVFRELHPDFTTCFSYENISDTDQASRVGSFVAPTEEGAANFSRTLLQSVVVKPPAIRGDVDDPEGWDLMADRLQRKLDDIERSRC